MNAGGAGPGQLTPLPSPPRSSPARPSSNPMSNLTEQIDIDEELAEIVSMEQDNENSQETFDTATSQAGPSASTTSQLSNSRRSGRTNPSTISRSRGGGGGGSSKNVTRGMSAFQREADTIERRDGRGGGRQDGEGRQGAEQNIWDKVLDKNGYSGQLNFDPFQELIDQRNSLATSSKLPTNSTNTLASPSPA
ncbi:hypothetical protein JCM5353_001214 [Sporobolomyces roseus]